MPQSLGTSPKSTPNREHENRVYDALLKSLAKEADFQKRMGIIDPAHPSLLKYQHDSFKEIIVHFKSLASTSDFRLNEQEKSALNYIRHSVDKIDSQLRASLLNDTIYLPYIEKPIRAIQGMSSVDRAYDKVINDHRIHTAIDINTRQLADHVKKFGIDQDLYTTLKEWIKRGLERFSFQTYDVGNQTVENVIHVKRDNQTGAYELDKLQMNIYQSPEAMRQGQKGQPLTITLDPSMNFIAGLPDKEKLGKGYTLYKDGQGKDMFMLPDPASPTGFKSVAFDVQKALNDYPITGVRDVKDMEALNHRLSNGRSADITILDPDGVHHQVATIRLVRDPRTDQLRLKALDPQNKEILPSPKAQEQAQQVKRAKKTYQRIVIRAKIGTHQGIRHASPKIH